ncbi:hypothetical protein THAOC_16909 [Thalassiosira oceanica]|uniref:Uncharacterized protein n=1 Tax=Thalassiosira oceanica TaxID=159749 RepID=K0SNF1_THAOC|nr:hypothetical protein THAOC_16909 [Thalassiosira oceanica]|eukprot:EJK62481.1 hypothetical protein THAOC_16909 [Thalassiosira oceanica]
MVQLPRQGPLAVSVVALLVYNNNRPILAFNDVSNVPRDSRKSDTSATIPVPGDDANVHNTNVANGGRHGALNQSKSEDSSAQAETVQSESTDQAESVQTEAEAAQSLASSSYYYNQEQHKHKERYKHHSPRYNDDATYLDLFAERAKELLTRHIIPYTDSECGWSWMSGRCEPYCKCSLMFLVGDYHLGRSCRLRSRPPPNFDATTDDRQETWQKAWRDMWHSQLSSEGDDHDHLSNFIPPLFQQREDPQTAFQWDTSMSCDLPPDNHYMKLTTVASNAFKKTVGVTEQLDRLKTSSSTLIGQAKANVQQARFAACAFVKTKLQERARIRGDIVLSQQGALVLKKMCGSYVGADSEVKAETD